MASKYGFVPVEREDRYGSFRLMAVVEGYVMARRKGSTPFVVTIEEWIEIDERKQKVTPLRPVSD